MNLINVEEIEYLIGYTFRSKKILLNAFTHSSYSNENHDLPSYDRLEFLGDSILNFVITEILFEKFPKLPEGTLTNYKKYLVGKELLSHVIDESGFINYLIVGKNSSVRNSIKVKCDLFESTIAAIYLDSHELSKAKEFILRHLEKHIDAIKDTIYDYKSLVKEFTDKNKLKLDLNMVENKLLEDNSHEIKVFLSINDEVICYGVGTNKDLAEQDACKKYYLDYIK